MKDHNIKYLARKEFSAAGVEFHFFFEIPENALPVMTDVRMNSVYIKVIEQPASAYDHLVVGYITF